MHADALPSARADERLPRYVALTRTEDFLLVTATGEKGYLRELIASGEAEVSGLRQRDSSSRARSPSLAPA